MEMPLYNEETGQKRRRPTYEVPFNKRSQALTATNVLLLQIIENRISSALKRLLESLSHLPLAYILLIFNLIDEDLALMLIQHLLAIILALRHRIRAFFEMESALGDIAAVEELPRGHANIPRRHPLIREVFTSDDQALLKTNFRIHEIESIMRFLQMEEETEEDGYIRFERYPFKAQEIILFVLIKTNLDCII